MKISAVNNLLPVTRRIGIVAFPESQILDISGPLAVFTEASRQFQQRSEGKQPAYQIELISTSPDKLVDCYCGVSLTAHTDFRSATGNYDTLMIAGAGSVAGSSAGATAAASSSGASSGPVIVCSGSGAGSGAGAGSGSVAGAGSV